MSSMWQLSFEKGAVSSQRCTTAYENKAGTHISWFSYYSNTFHPEYLQTKPYESISMTVQIVVFFRFVNFVRLFNRLREKSDMCICFYQTGRQLWLTARLLPHSASREESVSTYSLQRHGTGFLRNLQQVHHLHYGLHISWLFFTHYQKNFNREVQNVGEERVLALRISVTEIKVVLKTFNYLGR